MKRLIICAVGIVLVVACIAVVNRKDNDYLRLHIRANSNSEYDQQVKYAVKDTVVEAIAPLVTGARNKEDMMRVLEENIPSLEVVVDRKLCDLGQSYRSDIELCREKFPTRAYEELTLGAGVYDALIINLGSGEGDNWWCVAFPPLCFVTAEGEGDGVRYQSAIAQWWKKLIGRNGNIDN